MNQPGERLKAEIREICKVKYHLLALERRAAVLIYLKLHNHKENEAEHVVLPENWSSSVVPTSWAGKCRGAGEPKPSAPGRVDISSRLRGIYVRISLNRHWKKKPLVTLAQAYTTCVNTRKQIILRPFRETDTSVPLFQLLWNLRERQPVSTLFFPSCIFFNWTADFLLKLYLSVYCCTLWTCISAPWGQETVQPF